MQCLYMLGHTDDGPLLEFSSKIHMIQLIAAVKQSEGLKLRKQDQ